MDRVGGYRGQQGERHKPREQCHESCQSKHRASSRESDAHGMKTPWTAKRVLGVLHTIPSAPPSRTPICANSTMARLTVVDGGPTATAEVVMEQVAPIEVLAVLAQVTLTGYRNVNHGRGVGPTSRCGRVVVVRDPDGRVHLELSRVIRATCGVRTPTGRRAWLAANVGDTAP